MQWRTKCLRKHQIKVLEDPDILVRGTEDKILLLSFKDIVSDYKDRVYNTCLGLLKNESDAEDIAQEVFIEVYLKLDSFKKESSLFTWIYRISVNKCLEYKRKMATQKRSGNMVSLDNSSTDLSSEFHHPGFELENKETAAILLKAIDQLPENQHVAFTLNKIEGLSYQEIEKIMNKSAGSVESLIHRAKQNLRKSLSEFYEKV
ncbi:MAG: RNA polymerase sigma factor [Cyclobacteriaceae bacterium]